MARVALLTLFTLLLTGALVTNAVVERTAGALGAGGAGRVTGFGSCGLIIRCRSGLGFGFGFGAGLGCGSGMGAAQLPVRVE